MLQKLPDLYGNADKTDWLPANTRPVRIGWYEVRYWSPEFRTRGPNYLRYWTGKVWLAVGGVRCGFGAYPEDEWRGLAFDPSARKACVS